MKIPAGKLVNNYNQMQIELTGALDSLDRIRNIPIVSNNSSSLKVGDIALVKRHIKLPMTEMAIVNGKPALVVGTRMVQNIRVDTWTKNVEKQLAIFEPILPSSIKLEVLFDQNTYTDKRLNGLISNIFIGFAILF